MQATLRSLEEENAKRLAESKQFQQLKRLMMTKNEQILDLRRRLSHYEPEGGRCVSQPTTHSLVARVWGALETGPCEGLGSHDVPVAVVVSPSATRRMTTTTVDQSGRMTGESNRRLSERQRGEKRAAF